MFYFEVQFCAFVGEIQNAMWFTFYILRQPSFAARGAMQAHKRLPGFLSSFMEARLGYIQSLLMPDLGTLV